MSSHSSRTNNARENLALAQGVFYLCTGVWPLLSMRSFERVTGPKKEHWLVKTVGVLVSIIGTTLIAAGTRKTGPEVKLLALASAAGLTAIDVTFVAKRRIAPIYLLDAAAEMVIAGGWLVTK